MDTNIELDQALNGLTSKISQLDGGYDLHRKNSAKPKTKSTEAHPHISKNLEWFELKQAPPLRELQISLEKCCQTTEKKASDNTIDDAKLVQPTHVTPKKITSLIPGPSNLNFENNNQSKSETTSDEEMDNSMIHSFYEKTMIFDATTNFLDNDSSDDLFSSSNKEEENNQDQILKDDEPLVIQPKVEAPSEDDIQKWLLSNVSEPRKPIYKDYRDVTQKKEVGHNILNVGSDSLKGMSIFESEALQKKGFGSAIQRLRKAAYMNVAPGMEKIPPSEKIDQYLSTEESVVIVPINNPPSFRDAKVWIKARKFVGTKQVDEIKAIEEDSPMKIKSEKPTNVLKTDETNPSGTNDSLEDNTMVDDNMLNASTSDKKQKFEFSVSSVSPFNSQKIRAQTPINSSKANRSLMSYSKRRRPRLSLSKKLLRQSLVESPDFTIDKDTSSLESGKETSSQSSNQSNDTSEISVNSVSIVSKFRVLILNDKVRFF